MPGQKHGNHHATTGAPKEAKALAPPDDLAFEGSTKVQNKQWRASLIKAMGLKFDPFSSGVSEQDRSPDFGSIYVDLRPGLLEELQRAESSCIFADYGMGKTATRLALEYAVRLARTPVTLSVTYSPTIKPSEPNAEATIVPQLAVLAEELRVDLFIQYIERLSERSSSRPGLSDADLTNGSTLRPEHRAALERQARGLPSRFFNAAHAALRDPGPTGAFWRALRPVVRYVAVNDGWRETMAIVKQAARATSAPAPSWEQTIADVETLGFEQIFILIDAVDQQRYDPAVYLAVIRPLLAAAQVLANKQIYLKCFLPLELQAALSVDADRHGGTLTPLRPIAIMDAISPADLGAMVQERFKAAGSPSGSFRSLDWFGEALDFSIQDQLIAYAAGSPRRLIEFTRALIDFHSFHGFRNEGRLWLTPEEWSTFLKQPVEQAVSSLV